MPRIGLGLEPQHLAGARAHRDLLRDLAVQQLVVWHELDKNGSGELEQAGRIARGIDAGLVLHAVIPDEDYAAEVAELAARCREADISPLAISVAPAIYLSSITPGSSWPDVTPLADLYDEVRNRFPGVMLGGGMLSFFPELNRHRPPTAHLDYVTHASNTITHACDDMTVTENIEAIPYIVKTCRSFAGGKPYHVGPSSIGMRFNPYGSRTMDNPGNTRIAMARMDPRQRGLLNAAWTVGYVAHLARGGIDTVNLHAPTGEFGIIYHPQDWRQPGFDDSNRRVYPVFHCVAGFARAAGKFQLPTRSSMSREVQAVAYEDDGRQILWLANLTGDTRSVVVDGLLCDSGEIASISPDTFAPCTERADGLERTRESGRIDSLQLGAYSVARLTASATGPAIRE